MQTILSDTLLNAIKKIRLAIFDLDGVLTDGKLYLLDDGQNLKAFHCHDGLGLKLLTRSGVKVAIITSHQSPLIDKRMAQLKIEYVYQGIENKVIAYEDLLLKLNLRDEEVAYVGDDLPDIPLIRRAGFGVAVANATPMVKQFARYQTEKRGGEGAARELCELILRTQGTFEMVHEAFL